jgi:predicted dehydrogenase
MRTAPATKKPREVTADDHADILLRLGSGVQGRICASGMTPGGYGLETLVVGTTGAIRLDNQDRLWLRHGDEYPTGEWEAVRAKYPVVELPGLPANNPFAIGSYYLAQTLATLIPMGDAVLPDAASFYDGLVVQRIMDAVRESHAKRAWITL